MVFFRRRSRRLVTARPPAVSGGVDPLVVGDRVRLGWDDGVMGGGLTDSAATGAMLEWVPSLGREGATDALILLDNAVVAEGPISGTAEMVTVTATHAYLSTRYVGQDWSGAERTVHIVLSEGVAEADRRNTAWVTAHGVWNKETDGDAD